MYIYTRMTKHTAKWTSLRALRGKGRPGASPQALETTLPELRQKKSFRYVIFKVLNLVNIPPLQVPINILSVTKSEAATDVTRFNFQTEFVLTNLLTNGLEITKFRTWIFIQTLPVGMRARLHLLHREKWIYRYHCNCFSMSLSLVITC